MNVPPPIGAVTIRHVLEFYDEPVLFVAANVRGELFLVVLRTDDSNSRGWLFAPISPGRLKMVGSGKIDLHDGFSEVEGGHLWHVVVPYDDRSASASLVRVSELQESDFPVPDVFATPGSFVEPVLPDLRATATQHRRDVLLARMIPANPRRNEVTAGRLSRTVGGIQDAVSAIGQVKAGRPTQRASLPARVLERTRLVAVASHPGSFALELHADELADLYGRSAIGDVLGDLFLLLDRIDDEDALRSTLAAYRGSRVPSKLKALLLSLSDEMPELSISWASPSPGSAIRTSNIDRARASAGIRIISNVTAAEPLEVESTGLLEAADHPSRYFKFFDLEEQKTYAGRVADDLDIAGATIRASYRAIIRETQEVEPSGDVRVRYILVRLDRLDSSLEEFDTPR